MYGTPDTFMMSFYDELHRGYNNNFIADKSDSAPVMTSQSSLTAIGPRS